MSLRLLLEQSLKCSCGVQVAQSCLQIVPCKGGDE